MGRADAVKVPSFSLDGVTYEVQAEGGSCSCPHFRFRLAARTDGARCKHMIAAAGDAGSGSTWKCGGCRAGWEFKAVGVVRAVAVGLDRCPRCGRRGKGRSGGVA